MIEVAKIEYRIVTVAPDGAQYDLTPVANSLGWSEGEKELAAKITCKFAIDLKEQNILEKIQMNGQLIVYVAKADDENFEEMVRGNIIKYGVSETNSGFTLDVEAADEAHALRHTQEDYFFTPDHSSTEIIKTILDEHGVPYELKITDAKHEKKVYRGRYLADMIADVLKDLKEKNGETFFLRATEGKLEIIPRGTNETIYDFDIDTTGIHVDDDFDASSVVTKVKVVGKSREEGKQHVDAIVEGRTDLGVRQVFYSRDDKTSLEEAEKAAKKILEENNIQRKTRLEAPDLPILRKGDRIRLRSSTGEGYFFIKAIRHDAPNQKMSAELDYDKKYSEEQGLPVYDLANCDESGSSNPP